MEELSLAAHDLSRTAAPLRVGGSPVPAALTAAPTATGDLANAAIRLNRPLAIIERDAIETTIDLCGGSIPKAAKVLNISPSTIYRKKETWGAA